MSQTNKTKPLNRKAYGSIPHLPGSRMGPGDHHCHEGQKTICTEKARDKFDRVIVTEKLDGSCTAVANIGGEILSLGRAGWSAQSSPYEQHQLFAEWVRPQFERFADILGEGDWICGEWLAQAHGTRYDLNHEPWVAFDIFHNGKRLPYDEFSIRCQDVGITRPHVISDGPVFTIEAAMGALSTSFHGAIDPVEGAVWRVESCGQFDFLAKFVRPDKMDGCYLPEVSGRDAVWNWRPE